MRYWYTLLAAPSGVPRPPGMRITQGSEKQKLLNTATKIRRINKKHATDHFWLEVYANLDSDELLGVHVLVSGEREWTYLTRMQWMTYEFP